MADIRQTQQFGNFVGITAALTVQEVNASKMGREIQVTPQTTERWLGMMKATYQWHEIPAYSGNLIKQIGGKPKGYVEDTGFACALHQIFSPSALGTHPLKGHLFETFVVGEIRKMASLLLSAPPKFFHWRSYSGSEIDLLLKRDNIFYPIEIKMKTAPTRTDARGITAFRKHYPHLNIAPGLVISPTETFHKISQNDYALPWDTLFLNEKPDNSARICKKVLAILQMRAKMTI